MKRFYRNASPAAVDGGWQVRLDGRGVKTAGGRPQIVPTLPLAEALAAEWQQQGEEIDPASFALRDLADYALDIAAADSEAVFAALLRYAETDTLCYRAEPDDALHRRQASEWEPLLAAAEARHDVRFVRASGIVHQPQPQATIARLHRVLAALDPFSLAAVQTMASLAASLVIALAALEADADATELWDAANLEELWQAELWGRDAEAAARYDHRRAIFAAAARFARLACDRRGSAAAR